MRQAWKLGAALAAVAAVAAIPALAATGEAEPAAGGRTITVEGAGSVSAVPDVAEWSFGVTARSSSARRALASSGAKMRRVVAALRGAGIARKDIQTSDVSLYPRVDERTGEVSGYEATSRVRVIVRDLGRSGEAIEAAVEAGGTDVYGPSLSRSNREELYADALDDAFAQARAKAERLAATLEASLGRPVRVVEGGGPEGGDPYLAADGGGDALAIEPGEDEIAATLTVTFALE